MAHLRLNLEALNIGPWAQALGRWAGAAATPMRKARPPMRRPGLLDEVVQRVSADPRPAERRIDGRPPLADGGVELGGHWVGARAVVGRGVRGARGDGGCEERVGGRRQ